MKKKIYNEIEHGITYLVIESYNYYVLHQYVLDKLHLDQKYKNVIYVKIIHIFEDNMKEITYFKKCAIHNIYDNAFVRYVYSEKVVSSYYINNECYTYDNWIKHPEVLVTLRKDKLKKIKNGTKRHNIINVAF